MFNTGQFCMGGTPAAGRAPVYDDGASAPSPQAVPGVPVGDPFDAGDRRRADGRARGTWTRSRSTSRSARTEGGRIVWAATGSELDGGFFVPAHRDRRPAPTTSRVVQEEIFGPVLTVQPFDTEEEAIELANGTPTASPPGCRPPTWRRAHRVAAALQAGIVWVNGWAMLDPAMPFGGVKAVRLRPGVRPRGARRVHPQTKSVVVSLA